MIAVACVLLSAALLITPPPRQRRRLLLLAVGGRPKPLPPRALAALCAGTAAAATWVIVTMAGIAPVIALLVVGLTAGRRLHTNRTGAVRRSEMTVMAEALDAVVAELRAGAHPVTACGTVCATAQGSAATLFRRAAGRARLGADVAAGFASAHDQSVARQIGSAWRIAEAHGAQLAELLAAVRQDVRARLAFEKTLHASLGGARATAAILAGLPLIGIVFGELMGASPLHLLLSTHTGGILLVCGVLLAATGLLWSDRILEGARR